ncbi:MAG: hypothetical protein GC178_18195 [Flavobacteriales bacterium]|nr:hypothetical protein [Flavobacteriales bacterium]
MNHEELKGTTPVPNGLFDEYLPKLKPAELKLLLIIIRQTWGWKDQRTGKRKEKDWISGNQLREKTGCSKRALTDATAQLIKQKLIEVSGERGVSLSKPEERKGKLRLFYRFKNPCGNAGDTQKSKAHHAVPPAQKMPITKETPTKEADSQKEDRYWFTEHDIRQFEMDLNEAGSIGQLLENKEAIRTSKGEREVVILENSTDYRKTHLKEYSIPGLKTKNLRTPYSLWMTLYHRYKAIKERQSESEHGHENI